ncbi:MAG: DEAD/DEAH box helicase [Luteolibacter sp.]
MWHATVSNRVFFKKSDLHHSDISKMRSLSTVTSPFPGEDGLPRTIHTHEETDTHIGIPRMVFAKTFFDCTARINVEKIGAGKDLPTVERSFALRAEDQEKDVSSFLGTLEKQRTLYGFAGGIFRAFTGYGKSVTAIEMILRLGGRALIIVHQEALLTQWVEGLNRFAPGLKIGVVQGSKVTYQGADVVVATIQSLWQPDKVTEDFWFSFRTVVVDEIHRHGADKFSQTVSRCSPTYMIGMSGTVRRGDHMEPVFFNYIGDVLHSAQQTNRVVPKIYFRETGFTTKLCGKAHVLVHALKKSTTRTRLIAEDIVRAMEATPRRNPIVMSQSLGLLKLIASYVEEMREKKDLHFTQGFYIGGLKPAARQAASEAGVVYATIQLAKEGIDIPRLDTLFLASAVADPEQIIGRICRRHNENEAAVIDYVDSLVPEFRQSYLRRVVLYKRLGWEMKGRDKIRKEVNSNEVATAIQYARPLQ